MNISIEDRWRAFLQRVVDEGRFDAADDVVREGLRLVEEQEAKRVALSERIKTSIVRGGDVTDDELDRAIAQRCAELRRDEYSDALDRLLDRMAPETFHEEVEVGPPAGREIW